MLWLDLNILKTTLLQLDIIHTGKSRSGLTYSFIMRFIIYWILLYY